MTKKPHHCGDCGTPLLAADLLAHDCPERQARLAAARRGCALWLAAVAAGLLMGAVIIWRTT